MPGDPEECRQHAKRCWALAGEARNPELKNAADLEATHALIEKWGDRPEKKAG